MMGSNDSEQRKRIDLALQQKFGSEYRAISTIKMTSPDHPDVISPEESWGLLLSSGQPSGELVFYHFFQQSWVSSLNRERATPRDRAIGIVPADLSLEFIEKPGLLSKLIRSDVGKLKIQAKKAWLRYYEGDRTVREEDLSGPLLFLLEDDSVKGVSRAITDLLPRS